MLQVNTTITKSLIFAKKNQVPLIVKNGVCGSGTWGNFDGKKI
jgi:hypothetical protein